MTWQRLWSPTARAVVASAVFLAFSACAMRQVPDGAAARLRQEFIFDSAPTPSCHASTIAAPSEGPVAAWFGGSEESADDVSIWLARFDGLNWSVPERVASGRLPGGKACACWNPVLFQPRGGPLLLFYKVGPDETEWWGEVKSSTDNGRTWSAARRLPAGILGPIKNKPVQLANGMIVSGSSTEEFIKNAQGKVVGEIWQAHFELSSDGGATWTKVGPLADPGRANVIQPAILVHSDGRLQALFRSQAGRIQEAWSADGGRVWSVIVPTDLPNPDAGFDVAKLTDGRFLLVYNHTTKNRRQLNVAVSRDGRRWDAALRLEDQHGEFSYPAVIQTPDRLVHFTYTWHRRRIKHVVLDPARLELRPILDGKWPE